LTSSNGQRQITKDFSLTFFVTPFTAACVRYAPYWPDAVAVRGLTAEFLADTPLFGDVPGRRFHQRAVLRVLGQSRPVNHDHDGGASAEEGELYLDEYNGLDKSRGRAQAMPLSRTRLPGLALSWQRKARPKGASSKTPPKDRQGDGGPSLPVSAMS
jgi:hypothetical protein